MNKTFIWAVIIALLGWFVYISSNVMLPFVTSLILAYFISPAADHIQAKLKIKRQYVSLMMVCLISIVFIAAWVLLIPVIYEEITRFVKYMPKHKEFFSNKILSPALSHLDITNQSKFYSVINDIFADISKSTVIFVEKIWKSSLVFVNTIVMLILVPLITFYLIKDWETVTKTVRNLVPKGGKHSFMEMAHDINLAISGFVRGQLNVCLILAAYYAFALYFIDLNFGILIGITTGIVSFIPFLGLLGGFISATIVALFQFQSWKGFLLVCAVFLVGNIIESLMAPKLIGNKIGISPVWVIFFVLLGGSLFGLMGMLFAVPVGASVAIVVKFLVKKYYESPLYKR